jgi:hypothetical protein
MSDDLYRRLATLEEKLRRGFTTARLTITGALSAGATTLTSLTVGGVAFPASGTYTPTLTAVTNVAASGAFVCGYYRVGNAVTVYGKFDVDPTAAAPTFTEIGVSLPVASNFSAFEQCGGTGSSIQANQSGGFYGDTTNDRASYFFFASSTANATHYFSFSYQVI